MPVKSYIRNGKKYYYASFYFIDYTGQRKKKKKEGFTTSAEAKQYEKDFIDQHNGSSTILFKNLVKVYLADCSQRLKPTSVYQKKSNITNNVLPFFADFPISEITPLLVRSWQSETLKKGFAPRYMRMIHAQLSAILTYATKFYGLKQNPATLAGSIGTMKQQNKIQFYTLAEFKQFLPFVNEKYQIIFKILFFTGLRFGELMALTLKDFDETKGTLDINKTYNSDLRIILPPKTPKSRRTVTLPPFLVTEIQGYINTKLYEPQPNERLFSWLTAKDRIRYAIEKSAKQAGLPVIRIHDFRHSHASLLINLDFPPLVVSERLGHENVRTTLTVYSHLYEDKKANVAEKLDELRF